MLDKTEDAGSIRARQTEPLALSDFVAYLPGNNYFFMPTREAWPTTSVNARVLRFHGGGR